MGSSRVTTNTIRESNCLIFPVRIRFGFNSGFKFGSVSVKIQIN